MPLFFATTMFVSALLLFWVQPMIAKMLLPLLGGTPTVWNTCMVFFQSLLLAGYAYSHFLTQRLSLRAQTMVHSAVLLATFAALPIALSERAMASAPWQSHPFVWLVQQLFLVVALPFLTVSTTSPLLQHWFSRTRHRAAADPYFLYAASNLGSLLALLGYPLVIEPVFRLREQSQLWTWIYAGFVLLFAGCAWLTLRSQPSGQPALQPGEASPAGKSAALSDAAISWARRGRWVLWAFIPSSLMLGVTTYLTTDIASIPLLWVIPLALYLLTFVFVFARRLVIPASAVHRALPIAAIALTFLILTDVKNPAWVLIVLHLSFFFVAAMVSHGRLANDRPASRQLTEFYLWLSVGGVLGGLFNALLSPVVFRTVVEYPLMMVLACLVRPASALATQSGGAGFQPVAPGILPGAESGAGSLEGRLEARPTTESLFSGRFWRDTLLASGVGVVAGLLAIFVPRLSLQPYQLWVFVIFGVPLILCYFFAKNPVRFALGLGAVMAGANCYTAVHGRTLHTERNFFGALRVTLDPAGRFHRFYHGTTVHGIQSLDLARKLEPLAYYHRTGPFGQAIEKLGTNYAHRPVAVIGLGAGASICYAQPGQSWTFYEIDPAVIRVARDTSYFTFLRDATNIAVAYKLGDARLRLREAPPAHYGLILSDAFSSDVPPLHLLTREAMQLYLSKLAPDGLVVFNISSRYLDFRPVLGNIAAACGLSALSFDESAVATSDQMEGKYASHWAVLARRPELLGDLRKDGRWRPLRPDPAHNVWTDDYYNLLAIFNWR
jgi:hypothetical protein